MTGAFATAALELHGRGLVVIPAGGADGKTPEVFGWSKWRGQARQSVESFARKFGTANIGIVTGASKLTVVDADDEKTLADAESRFGQSPLVTRSPRGGGHLYYRSGGERNANLRREGMNADIRGIGGLVIAPPSTRPGVGSYRIERGSWDDLRSLPDLAPGSLVGSDAKARAVKTIAGQRNDTLFAALLYAIEDCPTLEDLQAQAHGINAQFPDPLRQTEADKTARSVWRLKSEGRLVRRGEQRIFMLPAELELSADGFYFLAKLRQWHGAKEGEPFAISAKAMQKAEVIRGWGRHRYGMARAELLAAGILELVHKGGAKSGDPSLYRMGLRNGPNITNTPLSGSPPVVIPGEIKQ